MDNANETVNQQPAPNQPQPKNPKPRSALVVVVVILLIILFGVGGYFLLQKQSNPKQLTQVMNGNQSQAKISKLETAKRTYFRNGQPAEIIEEKSQRNSDGSLETIVISGNKTLSRQLYVGNRIFGLSDGVLTIQESRSASNIPVTYLTTGENILRYVSQTSGLPTDTTSLNGNKATVYIIGAKKTTYFQLVKSAFAQNSSGDVVKVYVDESTKKLKKIEKLQSDTLKQQEVIDYEDGPILTSEPTQENTPTPAIHDSERIVSKLPQFSMEYQLKLLEEQLRRDSDALATFKEIAQEAKEINALSIEPSVIPDGAIYLNPLSIIPTASGYNSPLMELSSLVFNQQERMDKDLKEKGSFNNEEFNKNNIKVRIDGVEIEDAHISLDSAFGTSLTQPWSVRFLVPQGLSPGYHTVDVYMVDSWYLAPNILVILPRPDEKVLELDLSTSIPPLTTRLPENQGYRTVLKGKNFIKPFTVSVDSTLLPDSAVQVNGTEELILTLPANIPPPSNGPAYDITIIKDGQKVFRPSLLFFGAAQPPI